MTDNSLKSKLITAQSLGAFFFEGLNQLNNKSLCPVPQEIIFYSSMVLEKYSLTHQLFEINDGKIREKILGIKLLEAQLVDREERRKIFQDVGDTALLICGYFSESINRKILDLNYYSQLGKSAYSSLNEFVPEHLNVPRFYQLIATSFEPLTILISKLASHDRFEDENHLLKKSVLQGELSDSTVILNGFNLPEKKVS